MKVLDPNQSYTFSKIFELKVNIDELVKEFGYSFSRKRRLDTGEISLLGAVTTGKIWGFAKLDRVNKHLDQGLESYRVPEDLELLMRILVQALSN